MAPATPLPDWIERIEARIAQLLRWLLGQESATKPQRIAVQREIRTLLQQIDALIPQHAPSMVRIAYDNGVDGALKAVPQLLDFPEHNNFSNIRQETMNLLADNLKNSLGAASNTVGRRADDVIRRIGLKNAVNMALNPSLPRNYIAGGMQKNLERAGLTSFVDRSGRHWQLGTYSRMVIRTTTSEAQNRAVYNTVLGRGLDLVRVDKHEHKADQCTPYDGKTFSLTGATDGYPVLDRIPPFHPNCEHSILPAPEGLKAWNLPEPVAA